jgi:hypothetical protein
MEVKAPRGKEARALQQHLPVDSPAPLENALVSALQNLQNVSKITDYTVPDFPGSLVGRARCPGSRSRVYPVFLGTL